MLVPMAGKIPFLILPIVFLGFSIKFWMEYARDGRTQTLVAAIGCTVALVAGIVTSLRSPKKAP